VRIGVPTSRPNCVSFNPSSCFMPTPMIEKIARPPRVDEMNARLALHKHAEDPARLRAVHVAVRHQGRAWRPAHGRAHERSMDPEDSEQAPRRAVEDMPPQPPPGPVREGVDQDDALDPRVTLCRAKRVLRPRAKPAKHDAFEPVGPDQVVHGCLDLEPRTLFEGGAVILRAAVTEASEIEAQRPHPIACDAPSQLGVEPEWATLR